MADEKQVRFKILGGIDDSVRKAFFEVGSAADKLDKKLSDLGKSHKQAMQDVGMGAMALGAGIAAAVGAAVKSFADFDKEMSNVKAATRGSTSEMDALRAAALKAGKDTQYSATEAAQGIEELAKAGVATKDILGGGLTGALNLAAAGELSVADAADVAASTMVQFHLKGKDVAHIADLLAAGANKAMGEVSDLAYALRQAGPVASQMGLSVEDTVTALTELAAAGLTGSDAGTSLKTMMMSLVPSGNQASKMMEKLGLKFFDAQGKLKSFAGIAEELRSKIGGLSKEQQIAALKTIFGTDAYRAAAIVMDGGAASANKWKKAISESGFAANVARTKMDNLSGDVEQLRGSLETAAISAGGGLNTSLRTLTQTLTEVVNAFNDLPVGAQEAVTQVGAVGAGILLVGGTALVAVPKVVAFKESLVALGLTAGRTGKALRIMSKGLLLIGIAEAAVEIEKATAAMDVATPKVEDMDKAMKHLGTTGELTGAGLEIFKRGMGPFREDTITSTEALTRFGDAAEGAFSGGLDNKIGRFFSPERVVRFKEQITQLDASFADLVHNGHPEQAAAAQKKFLDAIKDPAVREQVANMFPQYKASLNDVIPVIDKAGHVVFMTNTQLLNQEDAAKRAQDAIDAYKTAIDAAFGHLDVEAAQDAVTKGFKDLKAAADKAGHSAKGNSDNAIALRDAWRGQIHTGEDLLKVMRDHGASEEQVARTAITLRDRLIAAGKAAGMSSKDLKALKTDFDKIPGVKEMELRLKTDPALHKKKEYEAELKKIPKSVLTAFNADPTNAEAKSKEVRDAFKKIPPWVLTELKADAQQAYDQIHTVITRLENIHDKTVTLRVVTTHSDGSQSVHSNRMQAGGGYISGPGTGTSDSIPAMLSNGEFVINAGATSKWLPLLAAINGGYASGGLVGFKHGGHAKKSPVPGENAAIVKDMGYGFNKAILGSTDQLANAFNRLMDAVAKRADKHANALVKQYQGKMLKVAREEDRVEQKLKDAQSHLSDLKKQRADEVASIRDRTVANAGIGTSQGHDLGSIMSKLSNDASKAKTFAKDIVKLRKMGLGSAAVQQIVNMGVDDGLSYAESLLSGGASAINQVNALEKDIAKSGTSLGDTVAGQMYDAGIRSAQGLVNGLQKEQKKLNRVMEEMARQMAKALKKALGIKSPSRVFAEIGHHTGAGLVMGLEGQKKIVSKTASQLIAASRGGRSLAPGGAGGGVVININGAIGNEQYLARVITQTLARANARGVNGAA